MGDITTQEKEQTQFLNRGTCVAFTKHHEEKNYAKRARNFLSDTKTILI
jgi:hypothetical protein